MKNQSKLIQSLQGKTITIIGMGVSNYPLISLLLEHKIPLTIRDKKPNSNAKHFEEQGAQFITGEGYLDNLTEEIIFRTPGLSPNTPELVTAREHGQHITSEMQEFFNLCPCPIIAVTGSDGKTTTTTLISKFLEASGKKVFLGGNIGNPLLCDVDNMSENDIAVLELSSFQLMDLGCSPDVAVLTNLSPNHLDYHKDMAEYVEAKCNIFNKQISGQTVIFNQDNGESMALLPLVKGQVKTFSRFSQKTTALLHEGYICLGDTKYVQTERIKLKGVHNVENYMAAILAVEDYCEPSQIRHVTENFYGVAHRMQLIRTLYDVQYYNDSIATSPTRAIAGLRSFEKRIILIAGGYDKGLPFAELGTEVHDRVKNLILCGATANAIHDAVEQAASLHNASKNEGSLEGELRSVHQVKDLTAAVLLAKSIASEGDCIVLSPACAAFDQFENFAQRGDFFTEVVNNL